MVVRCLRELAARWAFCVKGQEACGRSEARTRAMSVTSCARESSSRCTVVWPISHTGPEATFSPVLSNILRRLRQQRPTSRDFVEALGCLAPLGFRLCSLVVIRIHQDLCKMTQPLVRLKTPVEGLEDGAGDAAPDGGGILHEDLLGDHRHLAAMVPAQLAERLQEVFPHLRRRNSVGKAGLALLPAFHEQLLEVLRAAPVDAQHRPVWSFAVLFAGAIAPEVPSRPQPACQVPYDKELDVGPSVHAEEHFLVHRVLDVEAPIRKELAVAGRAALHTFDPSPGPSLEVVNTVLFPLCNWCDLVVTREELVECAGAAFRSSDDVDRRDTKGGLVNGNGALKVGHVEGMLRRY
eukprot:scaffold2968_cov321-Pinguiococcus_pyrenoidosus.AAC.17